MNLINNKFILLILSTTLFATDYTPFLGNSLKGEKLKKASQSIKLSPKKDMNALLKKEAKKARINNAKGMAKKRLSGKMASEFNRKEDAKIKKNKKLLEKRRREEQKKKKKKFKK